MYILTVKLKDFSAAHRLIKGYQGKCNHLHGHNYSLRVHLAADSLGENGLIMDFSEVRALCDGWVQKHLDHCTLVCQDDQTLYDFLSSEQQKQYVFAENTTVEVIAREIYRKLQPLFSNIDGLRLHQVEVAESRRCSVAYLPSAHEV